MNLSTAMRGALGDIYERLADGQLTYNAGATGHSTRTLDALQSRELITWDMDTRTWRRHITLTTAGLTEAARLFRFCPRCHSVIRTERKLVTIGFGPPGSRILGEPIKGPCPCRWHADGELAQ